MLLAHIADIHFRTPHCLNPAIDPDRPFRTRMIQDIRNRSAGLGSVDALLVGGDIAFKGNPEEYVTARAWLEEFASACGCPMERVFVVPGNHDVDRAVIANSTAVRNAQAAIMRSDDRQREQELRTQFSDTDSGRALVAPLEAYNEFAKFFDCQIFPPERLYWKQILPLEMGVQLHIHGLTSTFLSGSNGEDDTRGTLYLSPLQTVLDPLDDVINVVLCHHPPSWLLDHDEVDDAIRDRTAIQLFGHEHRARIDKGDGFIRCSAGAVNPDRYETGWKPGYNLINVQVSDENQDRTLEVKVHVLEWQSNPELYRPVLSQGDEPVSGILPSAKFPMLRFPA
ncbi:MAG: metallophosphoesterase, partial [Gemmatimonadota bacterium]|nr:metallophosphoesterase [Caldilineaceae bacterium]MDE2774001.1 metallophosphoesterase [Gemmatimonadota bacterium]